MRLSLSQYIPTVSYYIPDPYNSGPLILNEVGFFTGQSDPLITDQFQLENPLVHPVYDMFTIVGVCVCHHSNF